MRRKFIIFAVFVAAVLYPYFSVWVAHTLGPDYAAASIVSAFIAVWFISNHYLLGLFD